MDIEHVAVTGSDRGDGVCSGDKGRIPLFHVLPDRVCVAGKFQIDLLIRHVGIAEHEHLPRRELEFCDSAAAVPAQILPDRAQPAIDIRSFFLKHPDLVLDPGAFCLQHLCDMADVPVPLKDQNFVCRKTKVQQLPHGIHRPDIVNRIGAVIAGGIPDGMKEPDLLIVPDGILTNMEEPGQIPDFKACFPCRHLKMETSLSE